MTQWRVILESQLTNAIELTPGRLAITKQVASYFYKKGCAYDSCVVQKLIPTWRRLFPSSVRPAHLGLGSPSKRVRKRVNPGQLLSHLADIGLDDGKKGVNDDKSFTSVVALLTTFWNSENAPACSVRDPVSAPAGTQSMRMRR